MKGEICMNEKKKRISTKQAYKTMLTEYPDALNVKQLCKILGTSRNTIYKLFEDSKLEYVIVGRRYIVSKLDLIKFLLS